MAISRTIDKNQGTLEVVSNMKMWRITDNEDHTLDIGHDSFVCDYCTETHHIVSIREYRYGEGGVDERMVLIFSPEEAMKIVHFVLDKFELISKDEWKSAIDHISERRALGSVPMVMQA